MAQKTGLVIGATGLVGSLVLQQLLADEAFGVVRVLARRSSGLKHAKLQETIADFERIGDLDASVFQVDSVFSCLGTTLRRTGDPAVYHKIEVDYPLAIAARVLATGGKRSFHYVSSIASSSKSLFNYSRMKGEAEEGLRLLQSRYPASFVASYRPSFITGPRMDRRLLEEIAIPLIRCLEPLMQGPFKNHRTVAAEAIARAMIGQAKMSQTGFVCIESQQIHALAAH